MNRLRHFWIASSALITLALTIGTSADTKLDISNWKEILPDSVYTKLVEDSIKNLTSYTASASQFNQNGKKIQAEATNLMVYAEIARRAGNAQAGGLRQAAVDLLEAAKSKKGDEAKKLAAKLAGYKQMPGGKLEDLDLAKTTSIKIIMDVSVKEIDKNLTSYKRLTPTAFAAKGKAEEIVFAMYKLAALSVATSAHVPTSDLPKGKTGKDWLSSAEDMRKHSLAAAAAAKEKKLPDLKKSVNDLVSVCSKCHEDFKDQN